jgi:hypothetical protein
LIDRALQLGRASGVDAIKEAVQFATDYATIAATVVTARLDAGRATSKIDAAAVHAQRSVENATYCATEDA